MSEGQLGAVGTADRKCATTTDWSLQAFELFDEDSGGSIGLGEFANTMLLLGHVQVPLQTLEHKVSQFSFAEPDELNFLEFLTMMVSCSPLQYMCIVLVMHSFNSL